MEVAANKRIDAGIKRGKRKPIPRTGIEVAPVTVTLQGRTPIMNLAPQERTALLDDVLRRYMDGEYVHNTIAPAMGLTHVPIYHALIRERQEEWRDAQVARALNRLEQSNEQLETAQDPLTLARARERLRSAQWELERLLNRLYGPKQEVTINDNTDLGDRLRRARERVIEGETINHAAPAQPSNIIDLQPDAPQQSEKQQK